MKKIIVTGTQFSNKGAQSLLFSFVSEVRSRLGEDVKIYFIPLDDFWGYDKSKLKLDLIFCDDRNIRYAESVLRRPWLIFKELVKKALKRQYLTASMLSAYSEAMKDAEALVDLSGYQLGSDWSLNVNKKYLSHIRIAKKNGLKIILMPQSFGPFDYKENKHELINEIKNTLGKADVIYAREQQGYELLTNELGLTNVFLKPDFVLLSNEPDLKYIFNELPGNITHDDGISDFAYKDEISGVAHNDVTSCVNANEKDNKIKVGVIPNFQNFVHGDENRTMGIYRSIIDRLLEKDCRVVIFRHSNDLEVCRRIYSYYEKDERVRLNEKDLSCVEYSEYVKQFDFIVAARYHAIVHGYKNNVPAICLGWAVKYQDLAKLLGQERFVIDTRDIKGNSIDTQNNDADVNDIQNSERDDICNYNSQVLEISNIVDDMLESYQKESESIAGRLLDLKNEASFLDILL